LRDAKLALTNSKKGLQESRMPDIRQWGNELDNLLMGLSDIEESPQKAACDSVLLLINQIAIGLEGRGETENRQKQKVLAEMKAVQARITALRIEEQKAQVKRAIDVTAEIDALTEQQTDLIACLTKLTSRDRTK
jgi:hypothetical protein